MRKNKKSTRPTADPRIPDKKYFRIGEVAAIATVEPHVLRFWETEFASLQPEKSRSGQRTYARADVELVLRIRDLLYEQGFTIAGARKKLRQRADPAIDPLKHPRVQGLAQQLRKEVEDLLRLVED